MTDKDKLDQILARLKDAALVDEKTNIDEYWMEMEVLCDNSTNVIGDYDTFIKQLITFIES